MSTQPITLLVHSKVNTSDWCLGTAGACLGYYKVITLVTKSLQCGEQWQVFWSVSSLIHTGAATWRSFQFWWHTIRLWRWKRCSWCWWTLYFLFFFFPVADWTHLSCWGKVVLRIVLACNVVVIITIQGERQQCEHLIAKDSEEN